MILDVQHIFQLSKQFISKLLLAHLISILSTTTLHQFYPMNFDLNSYVSQTWNGGYKLELDLTAKSQANNWKLDFDLPYRIKEIYGVDLNNNNNGSYTISGLNDWNTLNAGQKVKAIFITKRDKICSKL